MRALMRALLLSTCCSALQTLSLQSLSPAVQQSIAQRATLDTLQNAVSGAALWRQCFLEGRVPDETLDEVTWPDERTRAACLVAFGPVARMVGRHPRLADLALLALIDAATTTTDEEHVEPPWRRRSRPSAPSRPSTATPRDPSSTRCWTTRSRPGWAPRRHKVAAAGSRAAPAASPRSTPWRRSCGTSASSCRSSSRWAGARRRRTAGRARARRGGRLPRVRWAPATRLRAPATASTARSSGATSPV